MKKPVTKCIFYISICVKSEARQNKSMVSDIYSQKVVAFGEDDEGNGWKATFQRVVAKEFSVLFWSLKICAFYSMLITSQQQQKKINLLQDAG